MRTEAGALPASGGLGGWIVVVPFKGGREAKSRLGSGGLDLTPGERRGVAQAFAADTLSAVASSDRVAAIVLVTSDPSVSPGRKTRLVPDPGLGLNAAVEDGIDCARAMGPRAPLAVLTSDLPALRPGDLEAALSLAGGYPLGVVADCAGSGTTLLTALQGKMRPRFGRHSYLRHALAGHAMLPVSDRSTLRADVDTPDDLAKALRLGVGPRTMAALTAAMASAPDLSTFAR